MKRRCPYGFAFALAAALLIGGAGSTFAQADGTIEIHKRVCAAGATGNLFAECHDNAPEQTVAFSLDGGAAQAVDASGNVVFSGLAAGTYALSETDGPPLDFVDLRVFCSVQGDGSVAYEVATDGPNFSIEVDDGAYLVCDVYNIPENLFGLTPQPTAATSVALPNTGSGVASGPSMLPVFSLLAAALLMSFLVALAVRRAHAAASR